MKLYTSQDYANQILALPFVGEVKLDEQASFDCKEELAEDFLEAVSTSIPFSKELVAKKKKEGPKATVTAPVVPTKEDIEKAADKLTDQQKSDINKEADEHVDVDLMTEAITDADAAELMEYATLVPGVNKKQIEKLSETELRTFLLAKVKEAGVKQAKAADKK